MSSTVLVPSPPSRSIAERVERARAYASKARASRTRKGYATAFGAFEAWCEREGTSAIPADPRVVAVYIAELADSGRKVSTIKHAVTAISMTHRMRGANWQRHNPVILEVMEGIRREKGVAPVQKAPLVDDELARLLTATSSGLRGARDRALLAVGWWGAFRRSELVALEVDDLIRTAQGYSARVRRSKTDQHGAGAFKALPLTAEPNACPVRLVDAWIAAARIGSGPIFRGIDPAGDVSSRALCDRSVALIVQRIAKRAGLNPDALAGHSLRAGFATAAALQGCTIDAIMRQTLHKDERVARSYVRHAEVFMGNAAVGLRVGRR